MKQQYMDKLLPLNEGGISTVKKIDPPKEWEGKVEHRTKHKKEVHEAPVEDPVVSDDASPDIVPPNLGRGPTDPLKPFRG
jgi:hypothetical protein